FTKFWGAFNTIRGIVARVGFSQGQNGKIWETSVLRDVGQVHNGMFRRKCCYEPFERISSDLVAVEDLLNSLSIRPAMSLHVVLVPGALLQPSFQPSGSIAQFGRRLIRSLIRCGRARFGSLDLLLLFR